MKFETQINAFTCTVACTVSVLADYGINVSQCDLILYFPDIFNGGPDAKRWGECLMIFDIPKVLKNYGLNTEYGGEHEIDELDDICSNPSNIIYITFDTPRHHCCRYISHTSEIVSLMDPWKNAFQHDISKNELKENNSKIYYFTKK